VNRFNHLFCFSLLIAILVCNTGCEPQLAGPQKLEFDLDPDDIRTILVDPSSSEHVLSLVARSDGPPIKIFVYLSEDDEAVFQAIMFGKTTDKIIASQTDRATISLNAKIPAKKEAAIRLQTDSPQKAKVTLTITN